MKFKSILCSMLFSLVGLTAFAEDTDISTLENAVYIESGATVTIDANGDAIIPIKMKNAVGVTGYQFNVVLPNSISKDNVTFKKSTSRKSDEVSYSGAYQTDGSYMAVAYTSDDKEFSGSDGEIVTMTIANATAGTYSFTIAGGSVTSHGTSYKVGEDVTSTVTIKETSYDEGYAVKVLPFIINTADESTVANVFINTATATTSVSFDVALSSADFKNYSLVETASLVSGRGTSCSINPNDDGTYSITAAKTAGFSANTNVDIAKFTIYSQDENGAYTIPNGLYTISISNIQLKDASASYNVAPYTADIYVGSPKATITEGKVSFSGDYSDADMAAKMFDAMPTTDATVTTVDLTGVTALPTGQTITTANPNALITTSTDLGLTNTQNVVVGKTCSNLVLTDKQPFATDKKFTATSASYTRSMTNAWGTICLPYAVTSDASAAYYKINGIEEGVLTIEKYETLPAGTPALVKKLSGSEIAPQSANVAVNGALNDVSGTVTMIGSYTNDVEVTDANAYYINNNKFYQCNNKFYADAFRAYFTVASQAKNSVLTIGEDTETAINALTGNSDVTVEGIYDVNGARMSDMKAGLNIVKLSNGKTQKIMVK